MPYDFFFSMCQLLGPLHEKFHLKEINKWANFSQPNLREKTPKSEIIKNFSLSLEGCAIHIFKRPMDSGIFGSNLNKFKKSAPAYEASAKRKKEVQQKRIQMLQNTLPNN